jgi:long-subunit fatty acid transport protein
MKKALLTAFVLCLLAFRFGFSQSTEKTYFWPGLEEYVFHMLPVGGWNVLGAFSPGSTAMGETFFSSWGSSSGYLNPAFLAELGRPQLSMSFRFTENNYKTYKDFIPVYRMNVKPETAAFSRDTNYLDQAGVALPLGSWVVAANYFLFQEYNIPNVKSGIGWSGFPDKAQQSGDLKGINVAAAHNFSPSFSMGFSVSYVFGDISRFQVSHPYYYILENKAGGKRPVLVEIQTLLPLSTISENHSLDLKGVFFGFGLNFKPGENWQFGLSLRPPFEIRIKAEMKTTYEGGVKRPDESVSDDFYMKQPFVAVASFLYKPIPQMGLTADLGYWEWGNFSTDFTSSSYYYYLGKSIFKLNLGASYAIELPFGILKELSVRAGYIYDPQPYDYDESFSRNFVCAGFCLTMGCVSLETAAKISIISPEAQRFKANQLRVGAALTF